LRKEHERLHRELKRLTLPKSPVLKKEDLNARMPSPIEHEDSDF